MSVKAQDQQQDCCCRAIALILGKELCINCFCFKEEFSVKVQLHDAIYRLQILFKLVDSYRFQVRTIT